MCRLRTDHLACGVAYSLSAFAGKRGADVPVCTAVVQAAHLHDPSPGAPVDRTS